MVSLQLFGVFYYRSATLLSTNQAEPEHIEYAVIVTIWGVFISRLIVHFKHLQTFILSCNL